MSRRVIIGIDPGKDGGIVALHETRSGKLYAEGWLIRQRAPRGPGVWESLFWLGIILEEIDATVAFSTPVCAAIELPQLARAGSRLGMGTMTAGQNWGLIVGMLMSRGIGVQYVAAATWQTIARDEYGEDAKDRVKSLVEAELPDLDLAPGRCKKPQDGLTDAAGIALWYLRELNR